MSTRVYVSFLAAFAVASAACDNPTPGTVLGTYAVASTVSTNSCGSVAAATDPGSFSVTISNDHGTVYWFPNSGGTSTSGTMNAARTVTISDVLADDVDATEAGVGKCTLQRNDTLSFTMATGVAPASFTGSYSFTVSPAIGANCADQLASGGGGYAELPCTVNYKMDGTLQ